MRRYHFYLRFCYSLLFRIILLLYSEYIYNVMFLRICLHSITIHKYISEHCSCFFLARD